MSMTKQHVKRQNEWRRKTRSSISRIGGKGYRRGRRGHRLPGVWRHRLFRRSLGRLKISLSRLVFLHLLTDSRWKILKIFKSVVSAPRVNLKMAYIAIYRGRNFSSKFSSRFCSRGKKRTNVLYILCCYKNDAPREFSPQFLIYI